MLPKVLRVFALLLPFVASNVFAQVTAKNIAPVVSSLTVLCIVQNNDCSKIVHAGLSNEITVRVTGLKNGKFVTDDKREIDPWKLILFIDERPIKGLYPISVTSTDDTAAIVYRLARTEESKSMWSLILANNKKTHRVRVSVGEENGQPLPSFGHFELVVLRTGWQMWAFIAIGVIVIGMFLFIGRMKDMFRESGPPVQPGTPNAYSLAKCQMGFWFFVVIFSYVLIWLITWDRDVLPTEVLVLLGISAGTFLGATAIDSNKSSEAQSAMPLAEAELKALRASHQTLERNNASAADLMSIAAQLKAKEKQVARLKSHAFARPHRSLMADLLNDANGYSFHRFQILVWTLVLAVIFISSVWSDLSMPVFSATLLGLMGISNGTYLGFKFPEQKPADSAETGPEEKAAAAAAKG